MAYRVSLLGPLMTWDTNARPLDPPTGQLQQILITLALRPGQEVSVSSLQKILWEHSDYTPLVPPLVSKLRTWIPIPKQTRGRNTYKTTLDRTEVDASEFIARVAGSDQFTIEEVDELLGMWRGDPAKLYGFLPNTEFKSLARARDKLIHHLSTLSRTELGQLSNLDSFRQLFEEQCESLKSAERATSKRLLIVDDDSGLTAMLIDLFRGYHCTVCHSLGEAMEIITDPSILFHGALVDLHLTKHLDNQGLAVLDALREQRPDIPRILLTSSPMADGMQYISEQYGLYEILVKNGNDSPTRTRHTVVEMLSDSIKSYLLRAHATLDTLAASVLQSLGRNAVAVKRDMRLGNAGNDDLSVAVERMDHAETSIGAAKTFLRTCTTAEAADAILTDFQTEWASILNHQGTTP